MCIRSHFCSACGALVGIPDAWPQQFATSSQALEWGNRFRAILFDNPETSEVRYELSGVSYRDAAQLENEISIDEELTKTIRIECDCTMSDPCWDRGFPPDGRHSYLIHTQCWDMIKRIIGPVAEERLDLLVMAMWERWTEFPEAYGVERLVDPSFVSEWAWKDERCGCLRDPAIGPAGHKERVAPVTDPFCAPALKNAVNRSKKRRLKTRMSARVSSNSRPPYLTNVSFDIRMLILDEFDLVNAANTTAAFCWQLPASYWRSRHETKVIFEADGFSADDLDWQHLITEYVRLSKSSYALYNRGRIYGILEGTRDRFFDALQKERTQEKEA